MLCPHNNVRFEPCEIRTSSGGPPLVPPVVVIFCNREDEKLPTKAVPFESEFPSHGADYPDWVRKVVFVNVVECCEKIVKKEGAAGGNELRIGPEEKEVTDEGQFWLLMMGLQIDDRFRDEIPKKYRNSKQNSGNFKSVFDEHYRSVANVLQQKGTDALAIQGM
jgi:hypothetical protein